MPKLHMTIVHDDDTTVDVVAGPKQQMAFERHHKKGIGSVFTGDNINVTDLYWLAWKSEVDHVSKHGGTPVPTFDVWADSIDDVQLPDGDDDGPLSP